eukprot:m.13738 g.13738  ORF g.13738 m.13738 type:complete len:65 (+) comp9831_c0_seq1:1080-1274(+)
MLSRCSYNHTVVTHEVDAFPPSLPLVFMYVPVSISSHESDLCISVSSQPFVRLQLIVDFGAQQN